MEYKDRIPTLPNRKKITYENGDIEYATVENADEPLENGTPLNKSFFEAIAVPIGAILMWSGSLSDIPKGWHLCNGDNGTPDLRGKFIVGAGNSNYRTGDTGGRESIDTRHKHLVDIWSNPSSSTGTIGVESGVNTRILTNTHTHYVYGDTSVIGNEETDIRPPYYALAYIMKKEYIF